LFLDSTTIDEGPVRRTILDPDFSVGANVDARMLSGNFVILNHDLVLDGVTTKFHADRGDFEGLSSERAALRAQHVHR